MKNLTLMVLSVIMLLFGCSSDGNSVAELGTDSNSEVNTVQLVADATFGNILTDANGMSLYFFSKDLKGNSECVDGCLAAWPIFYNETLTLDDNLLASDFGEIVREDGAKQNTYKGWPLYYFASDSGAGDTSGDGIGDNWYIAKPDYSLMYAQADINGASSFYMTNATGRTIYLYANDTKNNNNFTNEDFSNNTTWPVISLDIAEIPSILDSNDFGIIDVFGTTQVTYKGWPLYYFGNDTEGGDVNGVSSAWSIVNVDTEDALAILDITVAFANARNTNDGTDDFYEADILVSSQAEFKLGDGQIYFNYNTAAFGENIAASGNFEFLIPGDAILDFQTAFGAFYTTNFVDNTNAILSTNYFTAISAGGLASENVVSTPTILFSIKIKYQDFNEDPGVSFNTTINNSTEQFFTACGPFDSAGFKDCTNERGTQIIAENATFDSTNAIL